MGTARQMITDTTLMMTGVKCEVRLRAATAASTIETVQKAAAVELDLQGLALPQLRVCYACQVSLVAEQQDERHQNGHAHYYDYQFEDGKPTLFFSKFLHL